MEDLRGPKPPLPHNGQKTKWTAIEPVHQDQAEIQGIPIGGNCPRTLGHE